MAAVFVVASPCLLKYRLTNAGGAINIDAAGAVTPDLITDSIVGSPLRAIMAASYINQAAARTAMFASSLITIRFLRRDVDADWIADANVVVNALRITVTSAAADATGTVLEIRYHHTKTR